MKEYLRFREDGTFRVMQLTDMHYTADDDNDRRTVDMVGRVLSQGKPDLVVITGDLVYGEDNYRYLEKAVAPIVAHEIPWTFVFGNHDVEEHGDRETIFSLLQDMPGFVGSHDPASEDGCGNHVLPIYGKDDHTRWVIACIDSGDYNPQRQIGGYAYVTRAQQLWYEHVVKKIEEETIEFSILAFQHIPVPEIEELWRFGICYGVKREGFCSPKVNSGQFLSMLKAGHTKGLFFGHDHLNSFWGIHYGIALGYGRASGYGTYGAEDFPRGARMFVLRENDLERFETYEILENGKELHYPTKYDPLQRRDGD